MEEIVICSHYANGIFLRCPGNADKHLHCGSCGMYLMPNIKLSKAVYNMTLGKKVTIYETHRDCQHLNSHVSHESV